MKKIAVICPILLSFFCIDSAFGAVASKSKAKGQSVIQSGNTSVREKVAPSGIYSQECYDSYYGCMDQFCTGDSAVLNIPGEPVTLDGGTCACSEASQMYKNKIEKMNDRLASANTLKTVEVEKIAAGAKADIVFGDGKREYDKDGNVVDLDAKEKKKKPVMLSLNWMEEEEEKDISEMVGEELYGNAHDLCLGQIPDSCDKDVKLLTLLYSTQIKSDCKAFDNTIAKMEKKVEDEYASAEKDVRDARMASFDSANEYNFGECMLNFRKCMNGADVCGPDWGNCVNFVAAENMQNNKRTENVSSSKVAHVSKYEITDTTMEILDSKRNICEGVLDKCIAVRNNVWDAFIREVAPDLKLAEMNAESKKRQSCLTDISDCIKKACKDDIEDKGIDTMDSCLSRPVMVRSFCKNQVETCERMEPLIWGYVEAKLASMRVDRCTEEVKTCFTERCGENFEQCIGMDYDYMHDICPLDKLVVCRQNDPKFSMDDLDTMLMGLYLNIDNAALENCQNLVDAKMMEICGSKVDCNKFAADDTIGTNSLNYAKENDNYIVSGMISFGKIEVGTGRDGTSAGVVDTELYREEVREANAKNLISNKNGIIERIIAELENIQGSINRTLELLEQDPKIQFCVSGRDLSQINGNGKNKQNTTTARFPNMLNSVKIVIAESALRKANDNYNKKLAEYMAKATKESSADVAEYMCQRLPFSADGLPGVDLTGGDEMTENRQFAISVIVGKGIATSDLVKGALSRNTVTLNKGMSLKRDLTKSTSVSTAATVVAGAGGMSATGIGAAAGGGATAKKNADGSVDTGAGSGAATGGGMLLLEGAGTINSTSNSTNVGKNNKSIMEGGGTTQTISTVFNREARTCHICKSTTIQDCNAKMRWGGKRQEMDCDTKIAEPNGESCEDIAM